MHPSLQGASYHRNPQQLDQSDPCPARMCHRFSRYTILLFLCVHPTTRKHPASRIYHVPHRLLWLFSVHHCHLYRSRESLYGVGESIEKVGKTLSQRTKEVSNEEDLHFFPATESSNGRELCGSFYPTGCAGFLCTDNRIDANVVAVNYKWGTTYSKLTVLIF